MATTSNLGLTIWSSLTDPYDSSQLVDNFVKIDSHNHTGGKGIAIPFAGIDTAAIATSGTSSSTKLVRADDSRLSDGRPPDYVDINWNTDANYTIAATKSSIVRQTATLTGAKTATLPAANALAAGTEIIVQGGVSVTSTNTVSVAPAGSDTINGSGSSVVIGAAYGFRRFITDGSSSWVYDAGVLRASNNLSDLTSASTARTSLGLGSLATLNAVPDASITTAKLASGATIDKANAFATPRKINGVPFDGSADISLFLFRENDNLPITQTYTDGTVALSGTTLTLTPAADVTGLTLTASSPSAGYVTYTKNSHSFYVGETVVIAGFGAAGSGSYNGTFRIVSKTTNTFTVVNTATGGTPGSSGTAHSVFDSSMVGSILTVTVSGTQRLIPVVGYIDTLNLKVSNPNSYSFTTQAYTSIANTLSDGDEILVHTETNALPYVKNNGTSVYSVPISAAAITGEDGGAGTGYVTYTTSATQAFSYGQELTIVGTFNGGTGYTGTFTTTSSNPATGTFTVANASASGTVTSVTGGGVSVINTDTVIHMRYASVEKHWDYLGGSPSTTRDSANIFATSEQFTNATASYAAVDGAVFTFFYQGVYNLTISCNANTGGALTATVTTTSGSGGDGSQTYTTSTNPHNLFPGDKVVVTGLGTAANNGTFTVFSTPAANTFVVWNPNGTASTGQSGTATFYHENTVYVNAGTTTPANDYYAAVLKGVNIQSDISLSRPVVVTARNTTYNLYLKADSILGTPKIKNWSVTLTPLYYL